MEDRLKVAAVEEEHAHPIAGERAVLPDLFDRAIASFGNLRAIDFLGRGWSYAEIGERVDRVAAGLQGLGIGPGSRVGLCLPNTPYYVIFYFAVLKTGATVVNFNPLYTAHEIEAQGPRFRAPRSWWSWTSSGSTGPPRRSRRGLGLRI